MRGLNRIFFPLGAGLPRAGHWLRAGPINRGLGATPVSRAAGCLAGPADVAVKVAVTNGEYRHFHSAVGFRRAGGLEAGGTAGFFSVG